MMELPVVIATLKADLEFYKEHENQFVVKRKEDGNETHCPVLVTEETVTAALHYLSEKGA